MHEGIAAREMVGVPEPGLEPGRLAAEDFKTESSDERPFNRDGRLRASANEFGPQHRCDDYEAYELFCRLRDRTGTGQGQQDCVAHGCLRRSCQARSRS